MDQTPHYHWLVACLLPLPAVLHSQEALRRSLEREKKVRGSLEETLASRHRPEQLGTSLPLTSMEQGGASEEEHSEGGEGDVLRGSVAIGGGWNKRSDGRDSANERYLKEIRQYRRELEDSLQREIGRSGPPPNGPFLSSRQHSREGMEGADVSEPRKQLRPSHGYKARRCHATVIAAPLDGPSSRLQGIWH